MRVLILNRDMHIGGGVTYIRGLCSVLRRGGCSVVVMSAGGPMAADVAQVCDGLYSVPVFAGFQRPWLRMFLRRKQIDIVNVHSFTQARVIAPVCAAEGVPLIVTMHNPPGPARSKEWEPIWQQAAAVMVMNECMLEFCQRAGIDPDKLFLTRLLLDWPEQSPSPPRRAKVLAYCSRLSGTKGQVAEAWLRGLARMADLRDARLLVVGGGWYARRVRRTAKDLGLSPEMAGSTPRASDLFREVDVLAGSGYVALEGLRAGCAVVGMGFKGCAGAVTLQSLSSCLGTNFGDHALSPLDCSPEVVARSLNEAVRLVETGEAHRVGEAARHHCSLDAVAHSLLSMVSAVADGRGVRQYSAPLLAAAPPF